MHQCGTESPLHPPPIFRAVGPPGIVRALGTLMQTFSIRSRECLGVAGWRVAGWAEMGSAMGFLSLFYVFLLLCTLLVFST